MSRTNERSGVAKVRKTRPSHRQRKPLTPAAADAEADQLARSVRRALDILELFEDGRTPTLSMRSIIEALEIPKSTAYLLVRTLVHRQFLAKRDGEQGLRLGYKVHQLGMASRRSTDLLREGLPVVQSLRDETGETVGLSVIDGDRVLVLLQEDGRQPISVIGRIGARVPVNWAAGGRLLMSDLSDDDLRKRLPSMIEPSPTGLAPTNVADVIRDIRSFRAQGWGFELGQSNAHAGCVAAPVFDATGHCAAAVSIVVPEQRLHPENRLILAAAVRRAAATLSTALGARPDLVQRNLG